MRTILTIFIVLMISISTMAQDEKNIKKVELKDTTEYYYEMTFSNNVIDFSLTDVEDALSMIYYLSERIENTEISINNGFIIGKTINDNRDVWYIAPDIKNNDVVYLVADITFLTTKFEKIGLMLIDKIYE